jgi:hypothetical protein
MELFLHSSLYPHVGKGTALPLFVQDRTFIYYTLISDHKVI